MKSGYSLLLLPLLFPFVVPSQSSAQNAANRKPVTIAIENKSNQTLDILRGNRPGQGVSAAETERFPNQTGRIRAGSTLTVTSVRGRVWSFLIDGKLIASYETTSSPKQNFLIRQAAVDKVIPPRRQPAPNRPGSTPSGSPGDNANRSTGSQITRVDSQKLLRLHNQARKEGRVNNPPVRWSAKIARYAQKRADDIARARQYPPRHLRQGENPYGENLASGIRSDGAFDIETLANQWKDEIRAFRQIGAPRTFNSSAFSNFGQIGHYTQMIWRDTREIGAGMAIWTQGGRTYTVLVCCYGPAGNLLNGTIY